MKPNFHVRMSLLNPGPDVTPLKFRSWLRAEAASIDQMTQNAGMEHQVSVIRIFLSNNLRLVIGQRKLDRILQDVVDKFATIHRVELRAVDAPLTAEEMVEAQIEFQMELDALMKQSGIDDKTSGGTPTIH